MTIKTLGLQVPTPLRVSLEGKLRSFIALSPALIFLIVTTLLATQSLLFPYGIAVTLIALVAALVRIHTWRLEFVGTTLLRRTLFSRQSADLENAAAFSLRFHPGKRNVKRDRVEHDGTDVLDAIIFYDQFGNQMLKVPTTLYDLKFLILWARQNLKNEGDQFRSI